MKTLFKKYFALVLIVIILMSVFFFWRDSISKQWKEFKLNKEFVCPENQTLEQADSYRKKQTMFYLDNYPNITFSDFLSRRMQLLISHKCLTTLQNLAKDNNGGLPNQDSVNELKNTPYGSGNLTLKELLIN